MKKFTLFLMSLCLFAMVSCGNAEGNAIGTKIKDLVKSSISDMNSVSSQDDYTAVVTEFQSKFQAILAEAQASDGSVSASLEVDIEEAAKEFAAVCQKKAAELGIQ
ncbi:MAG: hypothetical protein R3Y19_02215 [Rikenellaceae bacterium]